MTTRMFYGGLTISILLTLAITSILINQNVQAQNNNSVPVVRAAQKWDTSPALRDLAQEEPQAFQRSETIEIPNRSLVQGYPTNSSQIFDGVLQNSFMNSSKLKTIFNVEGINNVNLAIPPDTEGDIGPDHYVQIVNMSFAVWDRSGNKILGPLNNNSIWKGFGGPCEITNNGDPIVLYDHLADRWLLSQFALPNKSINEGPFYQCIAISTSGDPTGSWSRYEYLISQTKLNDYPKFGVWPDGYYLAFNQFELFFHGWLESGQGVAVFERDQMLLGEPADMIYFDMYASVYDLIGMLPSDLDGPPPPAGAPNPYMRIYDGDPDQLQIWEFHVDWINPYKSTFTFKQSLPTAPFDLNMCYGSRNCIPQPGGTNVDAIADRLMYRLQYRNFGGSQSLVTNHTVDTDGSDHAGVRWYELRDNGGGWNIHQQGTYAPDSDQRWMGSAAMNGYGDIALGYSVSSTETYPSIRFTGRTLGDELGKMPLGEGEIIAGSGYQTYATGRWGDYSMMAVDPLDDCTFWYTQEYYATSGIASWQTCIASFKLRECVPLLLYFPMIGN